MTDQSPLAARLRAVLGDEQSVREVRMFGGQAFMVNDKLVASAQKDGSLLVRIATDRDGELREVPGASRAVMGADRTMGPGWLSVTAESIATDERLAFWVGAAMEHDQVAPAADEGSVLAPVTARPDGSGERHPRPAQ
ncbi:TfoX/Sxy family protein [Sanguibacter sp. 25GB23B1]|uniref:TfoX/Sxy family protein n=1 Tax=unclassified Sanguibacter TaxID=2645534 RepID=UPI0032AF245F